MNLDIVKRLYDYNNWAWDEVFASLEQLPDEPYKAARPYFWGSLHGLAVHGLTAEWIWLQRLQGVSPTAMLDPAAFADFAAVKAQWLDVRAGWQRYLASLSEDDLDRDVEYRNTRGNGFTLARLDILLHLVNHATEHRSQMTPELYALGVPTKQLDYMRFRLKP